MAVVLTSGEAADAIDDKLVDTTADYVKQNAVTNNQLEVNTTASYLYHSYCNTRSLEPGMLTKPVRHEAEATMYEAEAEARCY